MQKQRREQNQRGVVEKSDSQIEIAITADRRIEKKDKCRERERRKVQRERRGRIPIVVDAEGRIIWVAGLSVSEDFRVTDRTKAVVILKRRPA